MGVSVGRTGSVLAAVVAGALVAGCTTGPIGEIRRAAPAPPPGPADPAPTVEPRHVRLAVPPGAVLHQFEFTDAARGYALFVDNGTGAASGPGTPAAGPSGPNATNLLFGTGDGGRTWQRLRHPQPAGFQQLYTGNGRLVLWVQPADWYVSVDAGRSFRHYPGEQPPAAYHPTQGSYQVCCDGDDPPRVVRWAGEERRDVPTQPPLPGISGVASSGDRLLVSGFADGRPYASVSPDGGRSWRTTALPAVDGGLGAVLPTMAADGDSWLVGYHADDRTRFPRLWRRVGVDEPARWLPVEPVGRPERFTSAVPLGAGRLVVSSPEGTGLVVNGRYAELAWPVGEHYLRILDDGTLFAADPPSGEAWLGLGSGTDRRWVGVRLSGM
ncbi:hypothetical protein [Plantactinospora endophytica]|uniref:Exo-alpha-sialidase n=1 Tax=Plantactinospora endophytica TaxID=673535 RepID=A0ABQ4E2L7_9ACTN|nr:hypothetical protein [Plantactinospora endophytica]GIG88917.1 hypothetical protein Pen02_38530 [Plantactinospora endophytica]